MLTQQDAISLAAEIRNQKGHTLYQSGLELLARWLAKNIENPELFDKVGWIALCRK